MRHLTIRNISEDLAQALEAEKQRRGASLNATVRDLLRRGLGLGPEPYDNGLAALAGEWTEDDLAEFEDATAIFEEVDDELWK